MCPFCNTSAENEGAEGISDLENECKSGQQKGLQQKTTKLMNGRALKAELEYSHPCYIYSSEACKGLQFAYYLSVFSFIWVTRPLGIFGMIYPELFIM